MALNQSRLAASILSVFTSKAGIHNFEDRWASAYDSYARGAMDVSGEGPVTVNAPGFRQSLNFRASWDPATIARQFETAFQAYWTGAVFTFGVPPPPVPPCPNIGGNMIFSTELSSVVSLVTPGVMFSQLLPEFSMKSRGDTIQNRASAIASAMHLATTTAVIVLIAGLDTTPPPAGPLPVTNLCHLS